MPIWANLLACLVFRGRLLGASNPLLNRYRIGAREGQAFRFRIESRKNRMASIAPGRALGAHPFFALVIPLLLQDVLQSEFPWLRTAGSLGGVHLLHQDARRETTSPVEWNSHDNCSRYVCSPDKEEPHAWWLRSAHSWSVSNHGHRKILLSEFKIIIITVIFQIKTFGILELSVVAVSSVQKAWPSALPMTL